MDVSRTMADCPQAPCAKIDLAREEAADELKERDPIEKMGWMLRRKGVGYTARRGVEAMGLLDAQPEELRTFPINEPKAATERQDEVLGLISGDVVEVKSAEEILETLDARGAYKGLYFMQEMWRYCGQSFVVMKRLDKLMVETTGTLRTGIKNTVLLQGSCCDGSAHGDCAANCYHFWREVWLRRPAQA